MRVSCGIKLTTHHHGGQGWRRGAWLDMLDLPLNDCVYLRLTMKRILRLTGEEERLAAIVRLLHRTDPGPGGIYVDVGSPESSGMLFRAHTWRKTPACSRRILHGGHPHEDLYSLAGQWREAAVPKELLTGVSRITTRPVS
jgi:hypothetical protein